MQKNLKMEEQQRKLEKANKTEKEKHVKLEEEIKKLKKC